MKSVTIWISDLRRAGLDFRPFAGEGARAIRSRSKTICLPMRRTVDDAAALKDGGDFLRGRFQWLRLLAQPDGFDHIAGDTLRQAAGDGFHFREFGHAFSVYKVTHGKRALAVGNLLVLQRHDGSAVAAECGHLLNVAVGLG